MDRKKREIKDKEVFLDERGEGENNRISGATKGTNRLIEFKQKIIIVNRIICREREKNQEIIFTNVISKP